MNFLKVFFLILTIVKVFIEFATILQICFMFFVFFLTTRPVGSYLPDRDGTPGTPCTGRRILSHWTASKVPLLHIKNKTKKQGKTANLGMGG